MPVPKRRFCGLKKPKSDYKTDKTFRLTLQPRYLPGSIDQQQLCKDLKQYNMHRYNIHTATSKIDTKPPKFHALKYMKKIEIAQGVRRAREIDTLNKHMVQNICLIHRNKGSIDTWNQFSGTKTTKNEERQYLLRQISFDNQVLYKRIENASSKYKKEDLDAFYKSAERKIKLFQKYPKFKTVTKDDELKQLPSICTGFKKLRPDRIRVRFDFGIPEFHQKQGHIIIELYREYAPKTCDNFLAICKGDVFSGDKILTYENCPIHKIVKDKYLTCGNIIHDGKRTSFFEEAFVPENYKLKHTKAGVVSMIPDKNGHITTHFCITFDEMPSLDNVHVVFGKVVTGADNLLKLNDFGTKYGRPKMKLSVLKCTKITNRTSVIYRRSRK